MKEVKFKRFKVVYGDKSFPFSPKPKVDKETRSSSKKKSSKTKKNKSVYYDDIDDNQDSVNPAWYVVLVLAVLGIVIMVFGNKDDAYRKF